jgi:hypothetical protein
MKIKPTVHYKHNDNNYIVVGERAIIVPINHYGSRVSNTTFVSTSPVVKYSSLTGVFETENTRYVPEY